ncbi:MAG: tetratricopeptide repeat protein [Anaerolineae bacterium]|nr:tetratricopeptide repeat protein [Anaerolineae bacterium]
MSELLQTIAAYVPLRIVRTVLAEPLPVPPSEAVVERFPAAVLFADISGFTPLTEALGQKGAEGPEELIRLLNRYFSWMIAFIEVEGGDVVKFGGDALIAVFPALDENLGIATRRARQAAESMQSAMDEFSVMESSVGLVSLAMRIAIGAGEILATQIGGLHDRWEYIIAGDPLYQVAQAEPQAQRGEIVLSPQAASIIFPDPVPSRPLSPLDWASVRDPDGVETTLRCYVPKPVLGWLDQGLHSWLATLRPMSVLFVGVNGLNYEQANAIQKLHAFVRGVQAVIQHYQGSLPRLTVDDKGTVFLILFGAPPDAHEDDPERALRCALDLQTLAGEHGLELAIGVTTGRVFAGPVGSDTRREYTVMGDTVNLAVRLMTIAGPGQVSCNYDTYRSTLRQMDFDVLPPVQVKGKIEPVRIYRPLNGRRVIHPISWGGSGQFSSSFQPLVGRQAEMDILAASLERVQAGYSRMVMIEGEAGIGKSQLLEAAIQLMLARGFTPLIGRGRSIEQAAPYHAWRGVFETLLGLVTTDNVSGTLAEVAEQSARHAQTQKWITQTTPQFIDYIPLLNDVLHLGIPENRLTASLTTTSRHEKLVLLLAGLLRAWRGNKSLVLILEDAHWLDVASLELAAEVIRRLNRESVPFLFIIAMRPLEGSTMRVGPFMLLGMAETEHLRLDALSPEDALNVAAARLGLTGNELPEAVAELVRRRSGGNPFFSEELIQTLRDDGFITLKTTPAVDGSGGRVCCLVSGDFDRAEQILPVVVQSTILSRIDQLPPEEQLMLKVAAVIGHTFAYITLRETLLQHLEIDESSLKALLYDLVYLDLLQEVSPEPDLAFSFKNIVIQEVTYQSMLFDRRRQLHRTVAHWYEHIYGETSASGDVPPEPLPANGAAFMAGFELRSTPFLSGSTDPLAPYYPLLVYHWHQAEDEERERHYAALLGEQAVAQFANAEALGYLNRALDLTPQTDLEERYRLLLARETVYHRRGERAGQAQDLVALANLAEKMEDTRRKAEITWRQARYAEATGDYPAALIAAQQTIELAQQAQDTINQSNGYLVWGRILCRQGSFEAATEMLMQAVTLAQAGHHRQNEASSLSNLGLVSIFLGDYSTAQTYCQEALAICRDRKQRDHRSCCPTEAGVFNTLGLIQYYWEDYQTARDYFEQAIHLYCSTGNMRDELNAFYHIGLIYLRLGEYEIARDYFEQVLDAGREVCDRELVAGGLGNLGVISGYLGDYDTARSYLAHSLEIWEELGSKVGQADSLGKFGLIYHGRGDHRTTRRYCELALAIQQKIGNKTGECRSLIYLGHAQAGLRRLEIATTTYTQAMQLCREMGRCALAIDALAGLAHVALLQGNLRLATTYIEEIHSWLEVNGTAGVDNLLQVYLTMYRVLAAVGIDKPAALEQAQTILDVAYTTLQQRAARLSNKVLQRKFLEAVKTNREIGLTWQESR